MNRDIKRCAVLIARRFRHGVARDRLLEILVRKIHKRHVAFFWCDELRYSHRQRFKHPARRPVGVNTAAFLQLFKCHIVLARQLRYCFDLLWSDVIIWDVTRKRQFNYQLSTALAHKRFVAYDK